MKRQKRRKIKIALFQKGLINEKVRPDYTTWKQIIKIICDRLVTYQVFKMLDLDNWNISESEDIGK